MPSIRDHLRVYLDTIVAGPLPSHKDNPDFGEMCPYKAGVAVA